MPFSIVLISFNRTRFVFSLFLPIDSLIKFLKYYIMFSICLKNCFYSFFLIIYVFFFSVDNFPFLSSLCVLVNYLITLYNIYFVFLCGFFKRNLMLRKSFQFRDYNLQKCLTIEKKKPLNFF